MTPTKAELLARLKALYERQRRGEDIPRAVVRHAEDAWVRAIREQVQRDKEGKGA